MDTEKDTSKASGRQSAVNTAVMPVDERRLKILEVNPNIIVDFFNWWRNPTECIALQITDELPKDTYVVSINHSWEKQCLQFLIASKEFGQVPEYEHPPTIPDVMTEMRSIKFVELV